ncbi:MAG: hypothetical protein LH480_02435 [Rubrivivax sp.]|nr:hypothetical protein [Rubrivivax sp.]
MSSARLPVLLAVVLLLAACAEKPQSSGTRKADVDPSAGNTGTHTAPGWKAGDNASWEAQLKARSQGQNEYARTSAR